MPRLFTRFRDPSVPVRLNEQLMMTPPHSLLVVIGVVPAEQRWRRDPVPCRMCDLHPCSLRRVPFGNRTDACQ